MSTPITSPDLISSPTAQKLTLNQCNVAAEQQAKIESEPISSEAMPKSGEDDAGTLGFGMDVTTGQFEPTIKLGGGMGIGMNGDLTIGL